MVQINQQLVRFNGVLTEEINKKVLKTLIVCVNPTLLSVNILLIK